MVSSMARATRSFQVMRSEWWVVTGRLVVLETIGEGDSGVSPVTTIRSPRQSGEDLAGDVALQAAEDLPSGQTLGASSFDVGGGAWFALGDAGQHDVPQGVVGVAV